MTNRNITSLGQTDGPIHKFELYGVKLKGHDVDCITHRFSPVNKSSDKHIQYTHTLKHKVLRPLAGLLIMCNVLIQKLSCASSIALDQMVITGIVCC